MIFFLHLELVELSHVLSLYVVNGTFFVYSLTQKVFKLCTVISLHTY